MTTNVPQPQFTPTGLSVSDEQTIFAGVLADYVSAFALSGKALSTELTTPQGQLGTSQADIVSSWQAQFLQLIANVDPLTSSGSFQDALGRIYFLTRKPATYATVTAQLGGVPGQTVPAGAQVKSSDGSLWASQAAVTFDSTGAATAVFQALVAGATPVAGINDLSIYQQVPGWQTVANSAPSAPGQDVEGRAAFEQRRSESVQIGGQGTAQAVRAAIANVTNVTDVYVYNNGSDSAITAGATNYPIPAHSVAISVTGGADVDIATAIQAKLDAGCGMSTSGTTSVTLQDTVNYVAPYPQYVYRFVRATPTNVYMTVNVANLSTLPANYAALVQQAVAQAFLTGFTADDGSITISRARIGGQIVAAEFAAPVLAIGNITPVSLHIAFTSAPTSGDAVTMGIDQQPVCPALNITVNAVTV